MRLTKELKKLIVEAAVEKSGLNARLDANYELTKQIAEEIRVECLRFTPIADAESIELIHERLGEFSPMQRSNHIYVVSGARYFALALPGAAVTPDGRVYLSKHPRFGTVHKRLADAVLEKDYIHEEINNLESSVEGALNSVTTVAKLLKVWPEAAELLPPNGGQLKTNLPAIKTEGINKLIGLPSK